MSINRPEKKKIAYWLAQICGWAFWIFLNIAWSLAQDNGELSNVPFEMLALAFVIGIGFSHLQRYVILKLDWLKMSLLKLIPRVLVLSLFIGALCFLAQAIVSDLFFEFIKPIFGSASLYSAMDWISMILNWMLLLMLWSTFYVIYHFFDNYRREEIKNLKLESSMREIELNSLKAQLNPHFMFNSMNSIRALVDEDPELAKTAITQLSTILRNSLMIGKRKTIPLDEELNVVRSYLALESIRYEERLSVSINVDPKAEKRQVPPLMLQTLVENAIKHGISKLTKGGMVSLTAVVENGELLIKVENTGHLEKKKRSKESGIGLANTRKRLELLYGKEAGFRISELSGTVTTEIMIPEKTEYENAGN